MMLRAYIDLQREIHRGWANGPHRQAPPALEWGRQTGQVLKLAGHSSTESTLCTTASQPGLCLGNVDQNPAKERRQGKQHWFPQLHCDLRATLKGPNARATNGCCPGCRVIDPNGLQDRGTIVGHRGICSRCRFSFSCVIDESRPVSMNLRLSTHDMKG